MKSVIIIFLCVLAFVANAYAIENNSFAVKNVSGVVFAAEDGEPLRSVTVRVVDSPKGAFTNAFGEFKLKLEAGSHQLVFSMVGRERTIVNVNVVGDTIGMIVSLRVSSALKEGITVIAEDPGKRMMRRAIERKKIQSDSINSYKYLLYTKLVTSTDTLTAGRTDNPSDTTIISLFESYSNGYYKKPNLYFNEIFQRRQSVNIPPQSNFLAFGTNLNIYEDFINILGEDIYTPFHPDAPDFYDFILDTAFHSDEFPHGGRIIVTPESRSRRLFSGYINLDPNTLVPISVELYPNDVVRLPFNTKLTIKQSFQYIVGKYVMPQNLLINSTSNANVFGIVNPRLDIKLNTYAGKFEINAHVADELFNQRRVEAKDNADEFDSTFWRAYKFIPLEIQETQAYEAIRMAREAPDSALGTSFIDKYLSPLTRQFRVLNRKPFTGFWDMISFNRIQAVNIGPSVRDYIFDDFEYDAQFKYSFADKFVNYDMRLKYFFDSKKQYAVSASVFDKLDRIDDPYIIRSPAITLSSFFLGIDYGDYFYTQGFDLELYAGFGQQRFIRRDVFERPFVYKLFYRSESHTIAKVNTNYSFFGRKDPRENPEIIEGKMNTLGFDINWNFNRERRLSNFGFYLGAEFSSHDLLASDFDFTRLLAFLNLRSRTLPLWRLDIKLSGGYIIGSAPPQKFFTIESAASIISANTSMRGMKAKEFYGDRFASISFEHSFGEIIPGLIRIPNIAEFGVEFVTFANAAFTQFSDKAKFIIKEDKPFIPPTTFDTADKLYYEVGLGLNRLLIFLRADFSVRLSQVNQPQFKFTLTNASF